MTEKQKELIESRINVLLKTNMITEREAYDTQIQADIACQLTIANEIATKRAVNELRSQRGESPAYCENAIEESFMPTPAPDVPTDGLVEAVKLISSMECGIHYHGDQKKHYPCGTCTRMKELCVNALDAHEKEIMTDARGLFQALLPFVIAADEFKAKLPRPIPEDALDGCIEIELGFCENARQAINAYQKAVDADHEKAVR